MVPEPTRERKLLEQSLLEWFRSQFDWWQDHARLGRPRALELDPESIRVERDGVTVLKWMALEKRKNILGDFKPEEDAEKLHDILKQTREGFPYTTLIRETRAALAQFSPATPKSPLR